MKDLNKSTYHLNSLGEDQFVEIEVDQNITWMQKILNELQGELVKDIEEDGLDTSRVFLSFKGDLQKKINSFWKEHALLVGELKGCFYTQCIRTGELILEELQVDIQAVFINQSMQQSKDLEEVDSLVLENYEYDLYYYKGPKVDIEPVIHEQAFLNKNPYPVKKEKAGETL